MTDIPTASIPPATAIVLLAHGSRDPLWRQPIEAIAARIRQRSPHTPVDCAYIELCEPTLPDAVDRLIAGGASRLRVFPVFLGVGKHARHDMPELVAQIRARHPGVIVDMLPTAGEVHELIALLADLALRHPGPPT